MMATKSRRKKNGLLVGFRIRKLRKERNLTQAALATQVGIQQSDLCRMETGEYKVSLETLFKILSVFEMNIAEFFQEPVPATPGSLEGEVLDLFKRLDVEDQREVLDFLLFKVKQGDQRPGRKSAEDVDEGPMLVGNDGTQRVRAE
jgi:transcriptional regulator with XRE-family HTH domain